MSRKIKVWLGITTLNAESYLNSFELDYEVEDFEDPNYKICGFCKHIGEVWYDEDFIGIIPIFNDKVSLEILVSETPLSSSSRDKLKRECQKMGIEFGNAILFYSGETREINLGEDFNGLKYLGEYNV